MVIFSNLIENIMEVFMDDFSVYGKNFDEFLENLDRLLKRCKTCTWSLIGKSDISWSERGLSSDIECPKEG